MYQWITWLLRGKGVKKWLLLACLGIAIIWHGIAWHYGGGIVTFCLRLGWDRLANLLLQWTIGGAIIAVIVGFILLLVSFYQIIQKVVVEATHRSLAELPHQALYAQQLQQGPKIVAIGGGTGLSNFLAAIKEITGNLTAVVAVTDDGGSSGRLRRDLGILPPGDVRNCLIALSESDVNMEEILAYNFPQDSDLAGHNLGNLLMAGIIQTDHTDFAAAIEKLSQVLAIRGRVLPSTIDNVVISGVMNDGSIIQGETSMVADSREIDRVFLTPENCQPLPAALQAIREADYIFVGPGSLYTSTITNLLVPEVTKTIAESKALVYYICNLTTQPGEMEKAKASQYVKTIERHIGQPIFHKIIVNDGNFHKEQLHQLKERHCRPVQCDERTLEKMGLTVLKADLIDETELLKHNQEKLRRLILQELQRYAPNQKP